MPKRGPQPRPIEERFWSKVKEGPGCWMWTGATTPNGYGRIHSPRGLGYPIYAHRVSYEIHFGEIPEGMVILHRCDVPACVRPSHIRLGTYTDNMRDCYAKGRGGCQRDPNIILRGSRHYKALITEKDVWDIRVAVKGGARRADLARKHGVSKWTIDFIVRGRNWKSVPMP